jgi:ferric-dicitrate binding protein FerR (iron transport regulator)
VNLDELEAEIRRQRRGRQRELLIFAGIGAAVLAVAAIVAVLVLV